MRYATVCSGIEAPSVAWGPLGWQPEFFSEIEKFPCAVLAHHHPTVPNYGDLNTFKDWPDHDLDLICGGTPCQAFSVAGLRKGLEDPRGNLALTFCGAVAKYRPQWVVWENVPGVLSSGRGRDFGAFLGALADLGYGVAYRVLDAQFVRVDGLERAVPQRRRRVFVVGYFGDWQRAAQVLFEPQSLLGDHPPRRQAGQNVAPTIASRPSGGGGLGTDFDCDGGLIASSGSGEVARCLNAGAMGRIDYETETMVVHTLKGEGRDGGAQFEGPHATANIRAASGGSSRSYVQQSWAVRRLTPTECERLQGFPDGYTAVPHRGKPAADGPRYKALGNSMAVNCMRWIGQRIALVSLADQLVSPAQAELAVRKLGFDFGAHLGHLVTSESKGVKLIRKGAAPEPGEEFD